MNDYYSRTVTEYCERVGDHVFSEPINALTNLAFYIAAFFLYKKLKSEKVKDISIWTLWILSISIGTGSLLWHTFANPFTHALDAVPIWIFFLIFLYQLLLNIFGTKGKTILSIIIFITAQIGVSVYFPELFNGSVRHLTNIFFFSIISYLFYRKHLFISKSLIIAFSMYILAIIFRTIDAWSCSYIPFGTHFLWHLLNAVAVYFAIILLVELKKMKSN